MAEEEDSAGCQVKWDGKIYVGTGFLSNVDEGKKSWFRKHEVRGHYSNGGHSYSHPHLIEQCG